MGLHNAHSVNLSYFDFEVKFSVVPSVHIVRTREQMQIDERKKNYDLFNVVKRRRFSRVASSTPFAADLMYWYAPNVGSETVAKRR